MLNSDTHQKLAGLPMAFSPEMLDYFCDLLIMKLQARGLCVPTFQVD